MSLKSLNQKGFAAIEAILIIVIISILGGTGYFVYHANKKTSDTYRSATQSSSSKKIKDTKPKNAVAYQDSEISAYSMSLIAKTSTQKAIASTLDEQCQKMIESRGIKGHDAIAITGVKDLFTNTQKPLNFEHVSNFVKVNTGCYDKTQGGAPEPGGANYFLRLKASKWIFVTASQGQTDCKLWDGTGVPTKLVEVCSDEVTGTDRAPKP